MPPSDEDMDEAQPVAFPCDVEEWGAQQGAAYQILVGGFRHHVRVTEPDGLAAKKLPAEWTAEFEAWCQSPATQVRT